MKKDAKHKDSLLQVFDKRVHSLFLYFNRFNEFELSSAAVEVVVLAVSFEVYIALEVVGEEAETDFKGNEFTAEYEVVFFGGCEE